jgi:hypothetical protein
MNLFWLSNAVVPFVFGAGGGGVVGKLIVDHLIQNSKAEHAKELAKLRSDLAATNDRLKSELDRTAHVHQIQFETEFKAISEIWERLMFMRSKYSHIEYQANLHAEEERPGASPTLLTGEYKQFSDALSALKKTLFERKPFYAIEIYKKAFEIVEIAAREEDRMSTPEERWRNQNVKVISDHSEQLGEVIRQRLQKLAIYRN